MRKDKGKGKGKADKAVGTSGTPAEGCGPWILRCGEGVCCQLRKVEFMSLDGRTIGVQTLEASQLRQVSASAVPHERVRAAA